jgi:hypothetical protein
VEKKMKSLIVSIEVCCYKRNLAVRHFFDIVYNMYWAAEELDIPLESFPSHIEGLNVK